MPAYTQHTKSGMNAGPRLMVGLAFVLVLALGGWRAMTILTRPVPAPTGSQLELGSLSLLETLAGPGDVRLSIRHNGGGKTWLVLINRAETEAAPQLSERIESLLVASGYFDPVRDTLSVQQYAFAPGLSLRPAPRDYAELAIFAALAGLLGLAAIGMGRRADDPQPLQMIAPEPDMPAPRPLEPATVQPRARPRQMVAVKANTDPARAANVLRDWMNESGGNA